MPADASGVELALPGPPRRIVSLVPSTTELLCALGLADALVGVTVYCAEPADVVRDKPRVGGEKDPDLAAIRALAPDLVIANIEENVREHVDTLRAWGIPVWVTFPRTVAEGLAMIRDLGEVTGTAARAAAMLAELQPLYERVRAESASRPPVNVFYAIWRNPYMTVNRDTYISDLLRVCGARNVFADRAERYPALTLDEVASRRPEVIILPDEPFRFRRVHLEDFAGYPEVPAVRDGRIHLVDGKPFSWHGPRVEMALNTIPALITRR
ncbi:MAG TPA: cobalamin-binding protein [Candidatus Limnocylindria bacterium]|nr:cobalamin-binding protein [Candidatus Limnocylindria bacterium]